MGKANMAKNKRRFCKELLDERHGETLVNGAFEAELFPLHDFDDFCEKATKKPTKPRKMTVFSTNWRLAAYQVASWFLGMDRYTEIPVSEIERITLSRYIDTDNNDKPHAVAKVYSPKDSRYVSLALDFDASRDDYDYEAFLIVLHGIANFAHVPIEDLGDMEKEEARRRA